MALPTTVICFTCYDQLSEALKSRLGKDDEHIPILTGSLSRSMYWYNYEHFNKIPCQELGTHEPTFFIVFASGAASGSIASAITLPFDVVKTHRQTELWECETLNSVVPQRDSTSTWAVMRKIVAKNGITGLLAGIIPWLFKVAPACAIIISTYEYGKSFFFSFKWKDEPTSLILLHLIV